MSLSIPTELHGQFYDVCKQYGHAKQKGMVLSAAILMFLESDPEDQGDYLRAVIDSEISAGVRAMRSKAKTGTKGKPMHKAAKRAGRSIRGLPKLPDLGRGND